MKRDMDLVRKILMECEKHKHGFAPSQLQIEGYTEEQIGYHIYLMIQANLISGTNSTSMEDNSPCAIAASMTWLGHDFLEASRDDTLWAKAKQATGSMTMEVLKAVLIGLGTAKAMKAAGLP